MDFASHIMHSVVCLCVCLSVCLFVQQIQKYDKVDIGCYTETSALKFSTKLFILYFHSLFSFILYFHYPFVPLSPSPLSTIFHLHPYQLRTTKRNVSHSTYYIYHVNIFGFHMKSTSESCLMVSLLVKQTFCHLASLLRTFRLL